nr:MAG: glycosyltransferase [Candidatus Nanosalinarum sp. J07AB56]
MLFDIERDRNVQVDTGADVAVYHPVLKERGGAEKVVLEYARNSRHDVTVFCLSYVPEKTFDGFDDVEVRELGAGGRPRNMVDFGLRFGLGSVFFSLPDEFDALLVSETGLGSAAVLRDQDVPTVCYCHTPLRLNLPEFRDTYLEEAGFPKSLLLRVGMRFHSLIERVGWSRFEHVFANSENTERRVLEKGLCNQEDIEVLNPGVEIPEPSSGHDSYFLYPSRFRRYKRHELAIDAFEEADLPGDFDLVLAGSAQEQDYIEELRNRAGEGVSMELDVEEDRWQELYSNAHTVLFCAENEDWGMIPMEAAAHGKPVVAVDEGGPQESVRHGETGFLVEPEPEAMARRKEELAVNSEVRDRMSRKAREHAEDNSWEEFAARIDKQFEYLT